MHRAAAMVQLGLGAPGAGNMGGSSHQPRAEAARGREAAPAPGTSLGTGTGRS